MHGGVEEGESKSLQKGGAAYKKLKPLKTAIINLYGHVHSKEKFYQGHPYMYCVCLDAHDMRPVLLDSIIEEIRLKKSAYCQL